MSLCRIVKRENEAHYTVGLVSNWKEVEAKSPDDYNRFSPDSESKVSSCCHRVSLKNLSHHLCPAEQTDCDPDLSIFCGWTTTHVTKLAN